MPAYSSRSGGNGNPGWAADTENEGETRRMRSLSRSYDHPPTSAAGGRCQGAGSRSCRRAHSLGSGQGAGAAHASDLAFKALAAALPIVLLVCAPPGGAQDLPVISPVEDVDLERPEAWAMTYFGSISLLTPLGAPTLREPGSVEIALEASQAPHLSREERTVGFGGVKEEDLNRTPVLVRPRVLVGLPARFSLEAGWVPPVEVDGVEANVFSVALDRLLFAGERWSLGLRAFGQLGEVEGDITCTDEDIAFEPGSPGNRFGCEALSSDEGTLDHFGLSVGAGYRLRPGGRSFLHLGLAGLRHDVEFQVDAQTFGFIDRTLLRADGETWAANAGIAVPLSRRTELGAELFYSPLDVVRPPATREETDALFHVRTMLRYRVR